MKRCLWVLPKGIFPVKDGASVANQALLKSLRNYFSEVDIVVFNDSEKDEEYLTSYKSEFNATNVYFLKRISYKNIVKKLIFSLFSFFKSPELPVTAGPFHTTELKNKLANILAERKYDLIVFDCLHPFTAFMNLPEFKNTTVVYRAHNVEGDLWSTAASKTKNTIIQKLLLWQGKKMITLELNLIARAKKVWNIAEEDLYTYKKLLNGDASKLIWIPVGLEFKPSQRSGIVKTGDITKLLFLGKMDWAPNRDGLKWFLEEVWPNVNHAQFELQIVGSGDSSWGTELFKAPGIKFFGFVKDLDSVYLDCDFSIIPIRYGSGTRIKVIESISKEVPIISTEMGVQGSGLVDYFHAETAQEWIQILSTLKRSSGDEIARTAFSKLEQMYSPKLIGEKAFKSIS